MTNTATGSRKCQHEAGNADLCPICRWDVQREAMGIPAISDEQYALARSWVKNALDAA